jgi:hypothetical protein
MTPAPPATLLGPHARAAFLNGVQGRLQLGGWDDGFTGVLITLAQAAATYVRFARKAAEGPVEALDPEPHRRAAEWRQGCRELMAEFLILDPDDDAGPLRADGLDEDIAKLCDIVPVQ